MPLPAPDIVASSQIQTYRISRDGADYRLSRNFRLGEFQSPDGADVVYLSAKLVTLLQHIRDHFGSPVVVTSGYRTDEWNNKIGGVDGSRHTTGEGADVRVYGVAPEVVAFYLHAYPEAATVGLYDTHVHVSIREETTEFFDRRSADRSPFKRVALRLADTYRIAPVPIAAIAVLAGGVLLAKIQT